MPSPGDVLVTGIGAATSAAVTAAINAFIKGRNKTRATEAALADLIVAVEALSGEFDEQTKLALDAKVAAARSALA